MNLRHFLKKTSRALSWTAAIALVLACAGWLFQSWAARHDRSMLEPPGKLLHVDGANLHLHCTGKGSPTVILEAGATGFAQTWAWVQPALSEHTRVCSYDRPGMGWSSPIREHFDANANAAHLQRLLTEAGEQPPYLLAGHSMGGPLAMIFAQRYPKQVVGLALIDSSHPQQLQRFAPEVREQQKQFVQLLGVAPTLAKFGLLRVTGLISAVAKTLPSADFHAARYFGAAPEHLQQSHREMLAWDETMRSAAAVTSLNDMPLLVISAGTANGNMPDGFIEQNLSLHRELATLSADARHIVIKPADHFSILLHPDHAKQTADALIGLLEAIAPERFSKP